ncbi:MAG: MBL fold metallo-hydrolase [Desulfobacula sp.]|nr:MBL fold metallo-hydrolase [Desulfobacula sp.]
MQLQLIRNATMRLTIAGKTILTDPVLLPKHAIESFAGNEKNPIVELPVPIKKILTDIDLTIISHLHQDHFDAGAKKDLPKDTPMLCQPHDDTSIMENGFSDVKPVESSLRWEGIEIIRTCGQHAATKKWQDILGKVSGFIFKATNEPTIYWAGDTILYDDIEAIITQNKPDIIITHSCGAKLDDSGPIVMDAAQTIAVCKLAPWAKIVAVHLEALDHGTTTRKDIRKLAIKEGISKSRLCIPDDGQILNF